VQTFSVVGVGHQRLDDEGVLLREAVESQPSVVDPADVDRRAVQGDGDDLCRLQVEEGRAPVEASERDLAA
jgi:hypothetical protein